MQIARKNDHEEVDIEKICSAFAYQGSEAMWAVEELGASLHSVAAAIVYIYYMCAFLAPTGMLNLRKHDWKSGVSLFGQVLKREPENAVCWEALGICHYHMQHYTSALRALKKSCDIDVTRKFAPLFLGMCHMKLGSMERASTYFEHGVRKYPKGSIFRIMTARAKYETALRCLSSGNRTDAANLLDSALEMLLLCSGRQRNLSSLQLGAKIFLLRIQMLHVHRSKEEYLLKLLSLQKTLLVAYRSMIHLYPSVASIWKDMGCILMQLHELHLNMNMAEDLGVVQLSMRTYHSALKLSPLIPSLWQHMALLWKQRDYYKSLYCTQRALTLDPGNPMSWSLLVQLLLTRSNDSTDLERLRLQYVSSRVQQLGQIGFDPLEYVLGMKEMGGQGLLRYQVASRVRGDKGCANMLIDKVVFQGEDPHKVLSFCSRLRDISPFSPTVMNMSALCYLCCNDWGSLLDILEAIAHLDLSDRYKVGFAIDDLILCAQAACNSANKDLKQLTHSHSKLFDLLSHLYPESTGICGQIAYAVVVGANLSQADGRAQLQSAFRRLLNDESHFTEYYRSNTFSNLWKVCVTRWKDHPSSEILKICCNLLLSARCTESATCQLQDGEDNRGSGGGSVPRGILQKDVHKYPWYTSCTEPSYGDELLHLQDKQHPIPFSHLLEACSSHYKILPRVMHQIPDLCML